MDKLEEIKKLAVKATDDIATIDDEFVELLKLLSPLLAGADKRNGPALTRLIEKGQADAKALIRRELIKSAVAVLKGREQKK